MSKSIEIGIVGLPNVGKSTLFNALTKNSVLAANYPFATIEPNVGIVAVPDLRLQELAKLYSTDKIIPATVQFIDIAGLVEGASKGDGMGNKFLSHIRECNAICQVVREFENNNVTHVSNAINPESDISIINTELVLADLETLTRRISVTEKQIKSDPKMRPTYDTYLKAKEYLENNSPLFSTNDLDISLLSDLNLLTSKPIIYIFNVSEQTLSSPEKQDQLKAITKGAPALFINAQLEHELNDLSSEEASELLASYGQTETGLNQLIKSAYSILGLQSFLTAGPKEVRAWTVKKGATAPEAAGVIHTDFERGFISAEVVSYQDLIDYGSIVSARATGKVRTEGKTYIMQPDDIVEFRFNV